MKTSHNALARRIAPLQNRGRTWRTTHALRRRTTDASPTTDEQNADRLRQLGYAVEQLNLTTEYLEQHFTAAVLTGYHSPESLNDEMSDLANRYKSIAEQRVIGTSVQGRPI